jgi:hypothetical protein
MIKSSGMLAAVILFGSGMCGFGQQPPVASGTPPTQNETPARDPLEFYRRNPDLMKRYFPQLYKTEIAQQTKAASPAVDPASAPTIPEIRFGGGTAEALANILKEAIHPAPNILISPGMNDIEFPAFELHNVTLADLFQALNNLSDKTGNWQLSGSNEPIWVLNPTQSDGGIATGRLSTVPYAQIDPLTGLPIGSKNDRTCSIFPLQRFLSDYKVDDITTAIQTAWGMMGNDKGAVMKYHKDTQLLIVMGTRDQLAIINEILRSLGEEMSGKESAKKAREPQRSNPENSNSGLVPNSSAK